MTEIGVKMVATDSEQLKQVILTNLEGRERVIGDVAIYYKAVHTGPGEGPNDRVIHQVWWTTPLKEPPPPPLSEAEKAILEDKY